MRRPKAIAVVGVMLTGVPTAWAGGRSVDVELVRPTFALGALPGVDSPLAGPTRTVRVGTLVQQEEGPIVLYQEGKWDGTVVYDRTMVHTGMVVQLSPMAAARLVLPVAQQSGSDVPSLSGDGLAVGDLEGGVRLALLRTGAFRVGVKGDLVLPTSTPDVWMGERWVRGAAGATGMVRLGPVDFFVDTSVMARPDEETGLDYLHGTSGQLGVAARYTVTPDRFAFAWHGVSRATLSAMGAGGAENASEVGAGVQVWPGRHLQFDFGVGMGIAGGVGATTHRVIGGVTWASHRPPPPAPAPPYWLDIVALPEALEAVVVILPPEVEPWEEGVLARVEKTEITIRDPIQFEFGTANILPISIPTLEAISALLRDDARIAFLVVEGHASEEGSFEYNFDLSDRRARSVFQALVAVGVHPDRLSYRGMGEVVPIAVDDSEAALAANRRVLFRITRVYQPDETIPAYPGHILIPWSGEQGTVAAPPPPPPPPADDDDLPDASDFEEDAP